MIAADRAFDQARQGPLTRLQGISAMFDADVVMPSPKGHAVGRDAVIALFRENPSYKERRVLLVPNPRRHFRRRNMSFTYGFLSLTSGDPTRRDRKYLAYWIKQPAGWRVVAYRQQVRQPGECRDRCCAWPPSPPSPSPIDTMTILHLSVAAAEKVAL